MSPPPLFALHKSMYNYYRTKVFMESPNFSMANGQWLYKVWWCQISCPLCSSDGDVGQIEINLILLHVSSKSRKKITFHSRNTIANYIIRLLFMTKHVWKPLNMIPNHKTCHSICQYVTKQRIQNCFTSLSMSDKERLIYLFSKL